MREIKFRAWNKNKKITVYKNEDNSSDYWDGVCASIVEIINNELNSEFNKEDYEFMQYTGLKDKNGKEIYEGDIVKSNNQLSIIRYGVINVDCCGCCYNYHKIVGFYLENLKAIINKDFTNLDEDTIENLEVIGNIYENKELLKEKEQCKVKKK